MAAKKKSSGKTAKEKTRHISARLDERLLERIEKLIGFDMDIKDMSDFIRIATSRLVTKLERYIVTDGTYSPDGQPTKFFFFLHKGKYHLVNLEKVIEFNSLHDMLRTARDKLALQNAEEKQNLIREMRVEKKVGMEDDFLF